MVFRRSERAGFSLIELMVVVAIVGILAVIAAYGVRKYLASAKAAEARNSLGMISRDAISAFEKDSMNAAQLTTGTSTPNMRGLCGSASKSVPENKAAIQGKKYQSSPAEWSADATGAVPAGFACLRFTIDLPQYYMYDYKITGSGSADGDSFTATANGDLNGDGKLSTFSMTGKIIAGGLHVAPALHEENIDE